MTETAILVIIIIILVILILYFWRRDNPKCKKNHHKNEVSVMNQPRRTYVRENIKRSFSRKQPVVQDNKFKVEHHYPKPNAKATFDRETTNNYRFEVKSTGLKNIDLPKNFSAIKNWGGMILGVYDQERCGSCWAFATTSALTDRFRIHSKGDHLADGDYLSPFHLAACMKCGKNGACPRVCEGNYLDDVLDYLVEYGCVAQSDIDIHAEGSEEYRCFDYEKHNVHSWSGVRKYRINLFPPNELVSQKNLAMNETAIMEEIFEHGSVCCIIKVYVPKDERNFYNYKSGIYGHGWASEPEESDGYHAINIIGWGEDIKDGEVVKYWIIRNSWGNSWGQTGFGKVLKGVNFAMISSDVWGITPDLNSIPV